MWSFLKRMKKTLKKSPKTPEKKVKNSFLLQRKFPLLIQKCGFIYGKTCIYTVTVVSHLKLILSLCFLSHQRFYCRIESCSYPVNLWHRMNQSFRYICNFQYLILYQNVYGIFCAYHDSGLIWKTLGKKNTTTKNPDVIHTCYLFSLVWNKRQKVHRYKHLSTFQLYHQPTACKMVSFQFQKQKKCQKLAESLHPRGFSVLHLRSGAKRKAAFFIPIMEVQCREEISTFQEQGKWSDKRSRTATPEDNIKILVKS